MHYALKAVCGNAGKPHARFDEGGQERGVPVLYSTLTWWFGPWSTVALRSLQQELDLYGLKRKDNATVLRMVQYPGVEQGSNVAMYSFDIASSATGGLANGNWPGSAEHLEQFPSLFGQNAPQQLGASETDARSLLRSS